MKFLIATDYRKLLLLDYFTYEPGNALFSNYILLCYHAMVPFLVMLASYSWAHYIGLRLTFQQQAK